MPLVPLPVLKPPAGVPLRVTPTDVSQFVRLEQCERFLRFRLAERAGQDFMSPYDVTPQRISPLLSLSGRSFEEKIEQTIRKGFHSVHYAELAGYSHARPANDVELVRAARRLLERETVLLFQPRLEVTISGWLIRGDVDLLRLERHADGGLHALIVDLKSTTEVKVEHRLQVGFYHLMLESLFRQHGVGLEQIQTGVLYRPPADATLEVKEEICPHRDAARHWFGVDDALLEVVDDPEAYLRSVHDLVTGPDSTARRVASAGFDSLPYCLSYKCDGCLYNEFCLKDSAEREDLSLLPYMTGVEKAALTRAGVTTVESLARLKNLTPAGELVTTTGQEVTVRQLAATWPVGPRLDELIHRARQFRRSVRKDGINTLDYVPGKGQSTLPTSTPTLNPNLIRIYVEAQHDHLSDRLWCLAALVVGNKDGQPNSARRRVVIHTTDGPPTEARHERDLFVAWTRDLVKAVVEVASPERVAPIHFVLFDRHEQRLLLEALARNFPPIIQSTPPLYDLLTQLAGFDSPIATFLNEEVREFQNYPMTCQSLQSLAQYLRFDWSKPQPFRDLFKARVFDYLGKLDIGGTTEWYTKRSRFSTNLPLEYAYAAWGELPVPKAGQSDEFVDFRHVTRDVLQAFQERRLEAIEHVANAMNPNQHVEKTAFTLPDLANYEDKAGDLAEALRAFVVIERHVALNEWVSVRHTPPERRVLMGGTLLVRYVGADQEPEVVGRNRENQRRHRKRAEAEAAHKARSNTPFRVPRGQGDDFKGSHDGLKVKLRVETVGVDCGLHEALSLTTLREGDRLILCPRWAVDERLPAAQRQTYTPTPKQLLYGNRAEFMRIVATEKDAAGRVLASTLEVELKESFGGDWSRGFVFPSISRPLEDGTLYTLDPDQNDWYGYWCSQVVEGLCRGQPNRLYDLLTDQVSWDKDTSGLPGQAKFLAGLFAFQSEGLLHDFEKSKRTFIGGYGKVPVLLVQGPPGTGKSYSTAFAVFARLQGAMQAGRDCRVFVTCKTHAATDVLLENVLCVQKKLGELRDQSPGLFSQYLDARLLDVPLFRVAPHDPPPDGVVHLIKDAEKQKGEPKNADVVMEPRWCVVGITPGGVYGLVKEKWTTKNIFGHGVCDLLVLDEASQMNLPEAMMAALPLKEDGQVVVVGDHRQMPPIVKHAWAEEARRTFKQYEVFVSLFDTLRQHNPPFVQFSESFRLHAAMADFLREEVYRHDGINYFSRKKDLLPACSHADEMLAAILSPESPLVVVVHDEAGSQVRNAYEQFLIEPLIRILAAENGYNLNAEDGLGVVVTHRAQRAALQQAFPELCVIDAVSGLPSRSAIDTVERFQGSERTVIVALTTESDLAYLLSSSKFLLDPRRLTVALSRAKRKLVLVASKSIFSLFSPDDEVFTNSQLWKNLLLRACTAKLWEGERNGRRVQVWGGPRGDSEAKAPE